MEECILEREFMFEAHDRKAYEKLRAHQFPRMEQGIVYEPIANAMDQQDPGEPIEVELKKSGEGFALTISNNGPGLIAANLLALYYIGVTTKKEFREFFIGRFGMGLIGAFHPLLELQKLIMVTRVCGKASRITYDCTQEGIPTWVREDISQECEGMRMTFHMSPKNIKRVRQTLMDLLEKTIVPICFNGKIYHHPPAEMPRNAEDIFLTHTDQAEVYYCAHISTDSTAFGSTDDIRIYLRGMPVEEGEMYHMFVSSGGDKMPQNFYNRPYMKDESAIVLSRLAEPTVGRDKVVRNDAFHRIEREVERLRAKALCRLFQRCLTEEVHDGIFRYGQDMAVANLYSLSSLLKTHVKGESLPEEKAFLAPLLEDLMDYPLFPVFGDTTPKTLRQILQTETPGGVLFHAESREACDFLFGRHHCPYILKERRYVFSTLWGGHEKSLIDSILKPLVESHTGREMVLVDRLMWDETALDDLEKLNVLRSVAMKCSPVQNPGEDFEDFMQRLRTLLNRTWFLNAISEFHPPRRVQIQPLEVETDNPLYEPVAAIANSQENRDDCVVGLNVGSKTVQYLLSHENGEIAFLPILCHEFSHRRKTFLGDTEMVPHEQGFFLDRIRMEERVLAGCVRYLLGQEEPDVTDLNTPEVMIL
ncbi:MAG: ATP-binding protein [Deltaproteobacteria bacterium]|nr:ATP-binding protein [Deltaproteobacteria bacterium]